MRVTLLFPLLTLILACNNIMKSDECGEALNNRNNTDLSENIDISESRRGLSETKTAKLHYLQAQSLEGLYRKEVADHSYQYPIDEHATNADAGLSKQRLNALITYCMSKYSSQCPIILH